MTGLLLGGMVEPKLISHRIHVWYIYLHENHKNHQANVGKYTKSHGSVVGMTLTKTWPPRDQRQPLKD